MTHFEDFERFNDTDSAQILYASLDEQVARRASVMRNVRKYAKFAFARCIDGRGWSESETENHLSDSMISRRRSELSRGKDWLTKGAIACAMTHRSNLIGSISRLGKVICEDDAIISQSMLKLIGSGKLQSELEKLNGVTLLDYRSRADIVAEHRPVASIGKYSVHRIKPAGVGSAACYFVPAHIAKDIVSFQTPISVPVDHWDEMIAAEVFQNLYVVHPRPARIGDFPATIGYAYSNKSKWKAILSRVKIFRRLKHSFMSIRGDFKESITIWKDRIDG